MRYPLRRVLVDAWEDLVATDYRNQRINSERSLQAAFWSRLNSSLPADRYRLFVEPPFRLTNTDRVVRPDLIVCNTRSVIAVIEVKYEPRKSPSTKKDLETLAALSATRESLSLANERYLGETPRVHACSAHDLRSRKRSCALI